MFELNEADSLWPALAKHGTSRQRHLTGFRFSTNQQCRLLWSVIINYISIFNLSRLCYWKKLLVNHSSILHTTTCLPFRVWTNAALHMIIAYTVGLYYLKSVRCHWRLENFHLNVNDYNYERRLVHHALFMCHVFYCYPWQIHVRRPQWRGCELRQKKLTSSFVSPVNCIMSFLLIC